MKLFNRQRRRTNIHIQIKMNTINDLEKILKKVEMLKEKYPYTEFSIEVL